MPYTEGTLVRQHILKYNPKKSHTPHLEKKLQDHCLHYIVQKTTNFNPI